MSDDEQIKVVLNDRANLSSDRHKLLRIGAKQVSYTYAKATGTITKGTILFDAVDLPDLGNSVISRNMRVRYQVKITAGAGQLGMFNPNVSMDTGVGELHLPYGALRPFPLSTCTNACTVSINGSSNTVRLRDVMSAVTRTIPQDYLEKEATEGPSQLDNAWVLVSDNTIGTGAYMATSAQPLSSCYNCPNGTSRASFAPLSYVESGPTGDEAIFEVTEPILCSPMTLSAEETWLANVNVLSVLYVYSNLGDMCVYGAVTTDAGSVLPVYPPNYNVELVEGSARLIFGIATVDNEVIVIPPVVNYPYSKPDLHTTHLKPWVAPMSTGEVQNTGTVVSETIRLTYTPSLIYIYAQLPVNIRAQNAVATEYPYADVFYSLGSASGTTLAGLTYDTSQNILSIRWNRREGFLAGATIKDLYRVSVSNGYQSSFNDWLASPIIIINPVKDMGIDFSNDTYADMAGHNSLTVSCSFNTYNLLTRTAQVLGSQAPAEIGEFYSYLNTHVGAAPADANLLKMVNNVLQPLASFQMRDALGRLRPENTYVFYDPVDNVFFACGHTRKSLFLYAGLGATLGTLLDELVIDAIVSATYFEGRVTVCHARVAPYTDATEVSFYRSINNQLVQVEGSTLTHDAQGNPFTNITSASQDADNVVIANVLDISVFSRTGPQTYWYPIAVPPAGMLHGPRMLGAPALLGAGALAGYEYYCFGDGVQYVYLFRGTVNPVDTAPTLQLQFISKSLNEDVAISRAWYDPFLEIFWCVDNISQIDIYDVSGAFLTAQLSLNQVASNFYCSEQGSLFAKATASVATVFSYVNSAVTQYGQITTDAVGVALANINAISINGDSVVIAHAGGTVISTYTHDPLSGLYVGGNNFSLGGTVNALSINLVDNAFYSTGSGLGGNVVAEFKYTTGELVSSTVVVTPPTQIMYDVLSGQLRDFLNQTVGFLNPASLVQTNSITFSYGQTSVGYSTTSTYEYYCFGDGVQYVYLFRGTINPVDTAPSLQLQFISKSLNVDVAISHAWYDPFLEIFWCVDNISQIDIYDVGGTFLTAQLSLNQVACNFYCSEQGSLFAKATASVATVFSYVNSAVTQYGQITTDAVGVALANITAIAISGDNVVIAHAGGTILSTYAHDPLSGLYVGGNNFSLGGTVTALSLNISGNGIYASGSAITGEVIIKSNYTTGALLASEPVATPPTDIMYDALSGQLRDFLNQTVGFLNPASLVQTNSIIFSYGETNVGYTTTGSTPIVEYTITYDLNGGEGPTPTQAPQVAGATFNLASAPTRAGYTFYGWLDSFSTNILSAGSLYTMPAENITLTAQWTATATYTVTYLLNGPSGTIPTQAPQVAGATFNLAPAPTAVPATYFFQGWLDSYSSTVLGAGAVYTMPAQAVTFTAQWKYDITYDLSGGILVPIPVQAPVNALEAFVLPLAPNKAPDTFYGWQLGTQVFPPSYTYTMPSAPTAGPLTFTASFDVPPPVPPPRPIPPATFNQYYSFIDQSQFNAFLYSSLGAAALAQPTIEDTWTPDDGSGGPIDALRIFYDPLKSVYFAVSNIGVYLYALNGSYMMGPVGNFPPLGDFSLASFFPTNTSTDGTLIVLVGSTTVLVFEQVGSTALISLTATITTNYAGHPFTNTTGACCDGNCLVVADATGGASTTFSIYSREVTGYTPFNHFTINGLANVTSISVDEPFNILYVASENSTLSMYDLTNGNVGTTTLTNYSNIVFDQPTSQLRATTHENVFPPLDFINISTLQSLTTGTLGGHQFYGAGYATSPTVPTPPPTPPKYQYFSFIKEDDKAYLYKIELGVDTEPVLVLSFEAVDDAGQPIYANYLFYDALNERFWAVSGDHIHVYHRNTLLMAQQQFPAGSIISASFYPATGVGHSPQVVITSISAGLQTVQLWKTVGSQLVLAMPSLTVNNGSSLQCASRDASRLVIVSNTPTIVDVYDIAPLTLTNTFGLLPTVISVSVDTVGEVFYITDTNNHVQSYNLLTGVMVEDRAGITPTLGNVIYDTLSEGLVVGAFDLPIGAISLSPKTLVTLASYTFSIMSSLGIIGYSTSNTAPPAQDATTVYNLNGASGVSFPSVTVPVDSQFVVAGFGPPPETPVPTGFNFINWYDGVVSVGEWDWYTMPSGGSTLTAQWTYDITYGVDGGASPTPTQAPVSANTSFTVAPTPTRLNYTFVGWTDGTTLYGAGATYTMPVAPTAQPVTLTATWIASTTYTVTYSLTSIEFGGPTGPPPTQAPQEAGAVFNLATITPPTGYTFGRWTDSYYGLAYDMGEPYTMPPDDVTITAIEWTISVTYVLNGGIAPAPTQVPVGLGDDFVIGPAVSRVGYSFAGWNDGTTTYQPSATYTIGIDQTPITLTAQWTQVVNSYSVASLSVDSVNNQFYCVIDEYSGAGLFMSSMIQRRQITNGDLSATVTSGGLVYNIIYDYTSNQLVTASSLRPQNVDKLNVDTLAENTAYIVPCDYLGFTTSVPVPIVQDWATLPNLDFQIVCVEEGICQISPDFFRINTACMSMAEVKEAIETASQDGSFIPQSLDDSPRTLFGGQRAVISGTARGYDGDDDEESINSE